MGPQANEEMFPSLPTAAKPSTLMAGLTRGSVRWDDRRSSPAPGVNVWANGGVNPTPAQAAGTNTTGSSADPRPVTGDPDGPGAGGGKKKGGKKKGQVLYHFG